MFLLFFSYIPLAFPQGIYFPYYGKNKVLYTTFDWEHYPTQHFDIYYYSKDTQTLKSIADLAESAYVSISQKTKHELSARVPILFYITSTDFQQTNLFRMPEGVLGVAEPLLYRIAIRGDMPIDELQDLVEHELAHVFEYDLIWGSPGGVLYARNAPPDWIFEGFSEYSTENWSSWSSMIVRDAVLNDRIPDLNRAGELITPYFSPRPPSYDFGHALFEFIEAKYGKTGVRNFWQSLKRVPLGGRTDIIKRAFQKTPKEFSQEFKKYIREKHKHFLLRENPEDYSIILGPEFPQNPYYFALSHVLSPSGELVAVLTYNILDFELDVILFSLKDGTLISNLTKGYTLKYENIKSEIDPSRGRNLAWSRDGDTLAFFGRSGQKHSLFLISALNGKITKKIHLPQDQPASPSFTADDKKIIFTAFQKGTHDIYEVALDTEEITNLTNDGLFEKAPFVSPDGKSLVYTIRIENADKIFISPLDNLKKKTQITFGKGNNIAPIFSNDSKWIYFSGDMREAYNIYSVSLESGEVRRHSDVRTGNFFPTPLPENPNTLVFTSFNKGSFQLFKGQLEGAVEKTVAFSEKSPEEEYKKFEPILSLEVENDKITPHKGIGKLYMDGMPGLDTMFSTDGSIYGGTQLRFSDLFRDHTFSIMTYQIRSFRSYIFSYINQKQRLQFMTTAFQYTFFYYPSYAYYSPGLYSQLSYKNAIATRSISGANIDTYYPLNLYYRLEGSVGYAKYEEEFYDPYLLQLLASQGRRFSSFLNGSLLSLSLSFTGETTFFKSYGPAKGNTFRISLSQWLPIGGFLTNTTARIDLRQYLYIGADILFAFRFNGFASRGEDPYLTYFGGNNEVRSEYFYSIIGTEGWFFNLELRMPLVNAASTILGRIGPVRGAFFFDMARTKVKGFPAQFTVFDPDSAEVSFVDAIGSYGFGLEIFLLGLPIHIDFVKPLQWKKFSKPFDYEATGDWMTKFWIGFDF